MRIGIFGGSFNPVHYGHVLLARRALSALNLDRVYFVPANRNPLKSAAVLLPAALRLRLLRIALRPYPPLLVSDCELRRKGLSFTVDTLEYFRKKFPGSTLYFLCGADTPRGLARWKNPEKILRLGRFVAMTRPGHALGRQRPGVLELPFDAVDVSASRVREALARGGSVRRWVPAGTEKVLEKYYRKKK